MRTSTLNPEADSSDDRYVPTGTATASLLLGASMVLSSALGGTASTAPLPASQIRYLGSWTSTARTSEPVEDAPSDERNHDPAASQPLDDQSAVRWLHDESGLTWDQLGRVFGVSRRAVHLWANGGRLNAGNAEILNQLIAVIRNLPATTPNGRRSALLASDPHGQSIVDRFRARNSSGIGDVSGTPFTPDQLLGALHDDVAE
jgi:hypothetical protein